MNLLPLLLAVLSQNCTLHHSLFEAGGVLDTAAMVDSLNRTGDACDHAAATYLEALSLNRSASEWPRRVEVVSELSALARRYRATPRMLLAFGYTRFAQGMREAGAQVIRRAMSDPAWPDLEPRARAIAHHVLGSIEQDYWRDWRHYGQLAPIAAGLRRCEAEGGGGPSQGLVDMNIACPATFEALLDQHFQPLHDLKDESRRRLEEHFRRALAIDPTFLPSGEALAAELVMEERWQAVIRLTSAWSTAPADYRPLVYRGLARYRSGDDSTAVATFDSALALMPDPVRRVYDDPRRVMPPSLARRLTNLMNEPGLADAYWRSQDLVFLTSENERLLEHYSRVTEAGLLFGVPTAGRAGWDSDAGAVWIRYGRPLKIRDLAPSPSTLVHRFYLDGESGRTSFWTYGPGPDFVFARNLTYYEYSYHPEAAPQADLTFEERPSAAKPPWLERIAALEHQMIRLRGPSGGPQLLVTAPNPAASDIAELEASVVLLDEAFRPQSTWRGSPTSPRGLVVLLNDLNPGRRNVATEILDRANRTLFQVRDTLTLADSPSTLDASDILFVQDIAGDVDVRRGVGVSFAFGTTFRADQSVGLYWEVYPPQLDTVPAVRLDVTLEVRHVDERSLLARIARAIGRGFRRDAPATSLRYETTIAPTGNRVSDWIVLESTWDPGLYEASLVITDLRSGESVVRSQRFSVHEN